VPRWIFIAWLWLCVAYQVLSELRIVCGSWSPTCHAWSELNWVLGLSTGGLDLLPFPPNDTLFAGLIAINGAIATWAATRWLPSRLSPGGALLLTVGWYGFTALEAVISGLPLILRFAHH
jgi:hypothetical protein